MSKVLIPGRHLITSEFMVSYAEQILSDLKSLHILGDWDTSKKIDHIIIPITSANQRGSRYNPVPLYARVVGLERTFAHLRDKYGVRVSFVPIPHVGTTDNFAAMTVKYIEAQLAEKILPEDTLVWCSTKPVYEQYQKEGFSILPAEWDQGEQEYHDLPPNDILSALAAASDTYKDVPEYNLLSHATKTVWEDMPEIPEHIFRLWNDPLLTESGSLTEERDYSTYSVGMNNTEIMDIKFTDIKDGIVGGRIADEGCADGALMVRLAQEFPDSDIIGIDITGEFISRVEERQRVGEFGKSFVYAYQRNLLQPVFEPNSIDTVICNSTLHEIWSYGSQSESVRNYLRYKYKQLSPGGRLVIRDVVGPKEKKQTVFMKLSSLDGENYNKEDPALLSAEPESLSTKSRFYRFVHDFGLELRETGRRGEDSKILYEEEEIKGKGYIKISLKHAAEFLLTKDYTDNWKSEMNEEFTFWDIDEWKDELSKIGFEIVHDDSREPKFSHAYKNEWIEKNRFQPAASLWVKDTEGKLVEYPYPVTNMVLVGEKPLV